MWFTYNFEVGTYNPMLWLVFTIHNQAFSLGENQPGVKLFLQSLRFIEHRPFAKEASLNMVARGGLEPPTPAL
jgi:hypothetical protein